MAPGSQIRQNTDQDWNNDDTPYRTLLSALFCVCSKFVNVTKQKHCAAKEKLLCEIPQQIYSTSLETIKTLITAF